MAPRSQHVNGQQGFTLIELITVIIIIGITAGILSPFISKAVQSYSSAKIRNTLLTTGHLALERMAREIRQAVPNSLSLLNGGQGIEFLHARSGGRYIGRYDNFGGAFANNSLRLLRHTTMSGLYTLGTSLSLQAGDLLVIANTAPGSLTTAATGSSVALSNISITNPAAAPAGDGTDQGKILTFTASHRFPIESPGRHFHIADKTIEIGQSGSTLRWHSRSGLGDLNAAVNWSTSDPVLIDQVQAIRFHFQPGTPQATGILRIDLTLGDAGGNERLRLYHEVHIRNTP